MEGELLHVEGPHRLWLKDMQLLYYSLRLSSNSQHNTEEREGVSGAVCHGTGAHGCSLCVQVQCWVCACVPLEQPPVSRSG